MITIKNIVVNGASYPIEDEAARQQISQMTDTKYTFIEDKEKHTLTITGTDGSKTVVELGEGGTVTKEEIISALGFTPANTSDIPTELSELSDDDTHRTVTDSEKTAWNEKSNFSGNYDDLSDKPDLTVYSLASEAGCDLGLSIDSKTYIMTLELKNKSGEVVSTKTLDFPIESMVVNATYSNGKITLTLQNGTTTDVDISAIVSGLVNDSFTIAGIDMKDNITASELCTALGVPTESTVSGWGFTKNTGTYTKPSTGIPKTDLASAVQTSLNKADTALQSSSITGKADKISNIDIYSGYDYVDGDPFEITHYDNANLYDVYSNHNAVIKDLGDDIVSSYSNLKSDISTLQSNFQAGVDGIYDAIKAQGTTPASKSLSDVTTSIGTMSTNRYNAGVSATKKGTATASQVLSGYTFTNSSSVGASGSMTNNGAVSITLDTSTISYNVPAGYHNGSGLVFISKQTKTATPGTSSQDITPDSGKVLSKVTVNAISTETKTITPSLSDQTISPTSGKFISDVTVKGVSIGTSAPGGPVQLGLMRNCSVTVSSNGTQLTKIEGSRGLNNIEMICGCNSGNIYATISTSGTVWYLASSLDGSINSIAFGKDRYVCVTSSGKSYYSTNGFSWTAMSGVASGIDLQGVAYGNGRFKCVGSSGKSYYSTNGTSWTAMSGLNTSVTYRSIAYGNGRFVCVGDNGYSYYSSGTSSSWTAMSGLNYAWLYRVTYGADKFVAVGDAGKSYYVSSTSSTWSACSGQSAVTYLGIGYALGRFLVCGVSGASCYSTTGTTFTNITPKDTTEFRSVGYSKGYFYCAGKDGNIYANTGTAWSNTLKSGMDSSEVIMDITSSTREI